MKSTASMLLLCSTMVSASAQSFDWTFTGTIDAVIQDALFDVLDARFNNSPYGFSLNVQGPTNETDTNIDANVGDYAFNSPGSSNLTFTVNGNPDTTPMTFSTHIFDLQIVNSTSNPGLEELSITATEVTFSDPLPSNSNSYTMSAADGTGFSLFLQSSDLNFLVGDGIPSLQPDITMADQSAEVVFAANIDGQPGSNVFLMGGTVSVVPEPTEWAVIAAGLAGVSIAIRRRQQSLTA